MDDDIRLATSWGQSEAVKASAAAGWTTSCLSDLPARAGPGRTGRPRVHSAFYSSDVTLRKPVVSVLLKEFLVIVALWINPKYTRQLRARVW